MNSTKKIEVELKHLYRYLISICRYGYTRNNHLMPAAAFDTCRELLPKLAEVDTEYAIYTANQLAEEAISDGLIWRFNEGTDDANNNKAATIEFIKDLLQFIEEKTDNAYKIVRPYNYEQYLKYLNKENN